MPKDIHTQDSSQQRASRLLLATGVIVLLGALAYFGLTLAVNRRTPANPDTHFDAENGISVDYESAVWPVCQMTEDAALGHALQLASGEDSANANYQVVLFQRGDKATYEDFIGQSEADQKLMVFSPPVAYFAASKIRIICISRPNLIDIGSSLCIYAEEDFGADRVMKYASGNEAVQALITGKVDCVIIDNEPAKAYVAANNK